MNPFEYSRGTTLLHRLDTRCKLFLVCLISLSLFQSSYTGCITASAVFYLFLKQVRTDLGRLLIELRIFIFFLGILFIVRAVATPGIPVFSFHGIAITREGIFNGGLVALRFFLVMVMGLLFSATTCPASLKGAVQWFLRPLPLVPEKRVGVMISLALRFLPMIIGQAQETSMAIQSRCGNLEKNPVKRLTTLVLPLIKKTFLSADALVLAMDSRCFDENRTDPEFEPSGNEWVFIAGATAFCTITFLV